MRGIAKYLSIGSHDAVTRVTRAIFLKAIIRLFCSFKSSVNGLCASSIHILIFRLKCLDFSRRSRIIISFLNRAVLAQHTIILTSSSRMSANSSIGSFFTDEVHVDAPFLSTTISAPSSDEDVLSLLSESSAHCGPKSLSKRVVVCSTSNLLFDEISILRSSSSLSFRVKAIYSAIFSSILRVLPDWPGNCMPFTFSHPGIFAWVDDRDCEAPILCRI